MTAPLWQLTATQLSQMLAAREVSSRELVDAHLDRITAVDGRVNAFTDVFRDQARRDAERADRERADGRSRGPLHGLPVSVKECFDHEGQPTTLGISAWRERRATRDAAMVTALREAGAVILGRTNLSQTMLFAESRNPVFGQTANPFSLAHTAGGSSGGEAAAVASGMSPLGLGTDIGGSVRSPASFCGITAFKPTLDRLPTRGQRGALAGQEGVRSVAGPLARTVGDLGLFFRALDPQRMTALDARVPPLPWGDPRAVKLQGLRVGFYANDGVVTPSKAVARAVEEAAQALERSGCHVRPFTPPDVEKTVCDYLAFLSSDGTATLRDAVGDPDDVDPVLRPLWTTARLGSRTRAALLTAANATGQRLTAMMLRGLGEKSVAELWKLTDRIRTARAVMLDVLDAAGVDVIVCPAYATPALPHGMSKNFSLASSSALFWNILQFPGGTVPVTTVRPDETQRASSRDLVERHAAKVDAQSAGLPVGVQVVSKPWADETALAVMAAIEEALRDAPGRPHTPVTPP